MDPKLWEIDVNNYTEKNIQMLLNCKDDIIQALGEENNPTDTLVTKIMLGVFGNVPAFDTYFKASGIGVKKFNDNSLFEIQNFYKSHQSDFDSLNFKTIDFSGNKTDNKYTIC